MRSPPRRAQKFGRRPPPARGQAPRSRLDKVILLNDGDTPRAFVITVLKKVFRMSKEQAYAVMITAHRRGACVVASCEVEPMAMRVTPPSASGKATKRGVLTQRAPPPQPRKARVVAVEGDPLAAPLEGERRESGVGHARAAGVGAKAEAAEDGPVALAGLDDFAVRLVQKANASAKALGSWNAR